MFVLHVRAATGVPFRVRRVTFAHRAPPDVSEHERIFGCPVRFEAEHNRLVLDRAAWETPTSGAHSGHAAGAERARRTAAGEAPARPRSRRAHAARHRRAPPRRRPVARERGARLGHERAQLAAAPARARLHLQRARRRGPRGDGAPVPEQPDIALAEVGYLLGFADQSTFNRAFKRWTGRTPRQARDDVRRAPRPGRPARLSRPVAPAAHTLASLAKSRRSGGPIVAASSRRPIDEAVNRTALAPVLGVALALSATGCMDPDAPGNLVPATVDDDPSLPRIEVARDDPARGGVRRSERADDHGAARRPGRRLPRAPAVPRARRRRLLRRLLGPARHRACRSDTTRRATRSTSTSRISAW